MLTPYVNFRDKLFLGHCFDTGPQSRTFSDCFEKAFQFTWCESVKYFDDFRRPASEKRRFLFCRSRGSPRSETCFDKILVLLSLCRRPCTFQIVAFSSGPDAFQVLYFLSQLSTPPTHHST